MTAPVGPLTNRLGFLGPLFRLWPWTAILGEATCRSAWLLPRSMRLSNFVKQDASLPGHPLKQQQLAQFLLGKAASRVEAARDTLFVLPTLYMMTWRSAGNYCPISKVRVQLAASFAAEACAEAVQLHQ